MNPSTSFRSFFFAIAMLVGVVKMFSSWRKKQKEMSASLADPAMSNEDRVRHLVRTGRDIQAIRLFARVNGTTDIEAEAAIRAIKKELGVP